MFLVGQVSGLVEKFSIGIFSDTVNVPNVKLCVTLSFTCSLHFSDLDSISWSQQCQVVLAENFVFLSN